MAIVISIFSPKKNESKMGVTVNLAKSLLRQKNRVLVIDFNPQAETSNYLSMWHPMLIRCTIFNIIFGDRCIDDCIQKKTKIKGVHLAPSNIRLMKLDNILRDVYFGSTTYLRNKIELIQEEYDYILIDCSPCFSLLTATALNASDYYITPFDTSDTYALAGMEGYKDFILRSTLYKQRLKLMGLLALNYQPKKYICQSNLVLAKEVFSSVFDATVSSGGYLKEVSQRTVLREYENLVNEIYSIVN